MQKLDFPYLLYKTVVGKSTVDVIELFDCMQKSPTLLIMKSDETHIRKCHMELFKNTTDLIGLKDNNINISFVNLAS